MQSHFTYLSYFIESPDWQKFVMALILGGALAWFAKSSSAKLAAAGAENLIVPAAKPSAFGVFDFFLEAFVAFHDSILGKENRRYVPFCGSLFLFVLLANFLGLVPGMPAITTTVWVNVGLALVVFFVFNAQGVKAHGIKGYLKHFCGPILWLAPLMFPLEIFSTALRILTLNLRLYWNISADHILLGVITDLAPGVPIIFYVMGTLVCFMQALVFTLLTMIYILIATSHEEEGADGHGHH